MHFSIFHLSLIQKEFGSCASIPHHDVNQSTEHQDNQKFTSKSTMLIWTKMRRAPRYRELFVGFAEDCLYSQWKLSYKKALSESSLLFRRGRHGKKACESIAWNKQIKLTCQDQAILAGFYPANIRMVYKTSFRTGFLLKEIIQKRTRIYWDNINSPAGL